MRSITTKTPDPNTHPNYDPLFRTKAAAVYLGISDEELKRLARRGEIASVRGTRNAASERTHWRFRLSALNKWIADHEKPVSRNAR